ncbi:hypothetical protein Pint_23036 [Pistacia integerrima]|uniref:Uncharacterized protein n=1 Tax=Pistacia integerrima TaxID=434235 RepID=A0ACC0YKT5_9ROSI|nr:hypothetical protein Pint_23036 [Pistacia integerrima]
MVMLEFLDVGLNTLTKAAMSGGMSHPLSLLSTLISCQASFLVPCSFIFYRQRSRPQLTWSIAYRIFILGLLRMFHYIGIEYSSPTLASAMIDLTPGFTFYTLP